MTLGIIERFKRIVPIDNPSGGEATIREYIAQVLQSVGGIQQRVDEAGNLFVQVPGALSKTSILFSAHMDSVPPCHGIVPIEDTLEGRSIIRSQGQTILGADDKAGIATLLEVVTKLSQEQFKNNHPLELFFSTGEEVGLIGAKAFDRSWITAPYGYVVDGEGQMGELFNAGPFQENIQIRCLGKASHAGIAPEAGINAIQVAAALCASLPNGRLGPHLTTNLGVIQGGEALNVVAPEVLIRGEARSHQEPDLLGLLEQYQTACQAAEKRFPGSQVELVTVRRYNGYQIDSAHPVVQKAKQACEQLGVTPSIKPMNIGSDAHILNQKGLPTVVLGMGFHYSHSLGEYIFQDEMQQVLDLVYLLCTV